MTQFRARTVASRWESMLERIAAATKSKQGPGEFRLMSDGESIHTNAVDAAAVLMVDFRASPGVFDELMVADGLEVGVKIGRMLEVLDLADDGDVITIELNDNGRFVMDGPGFEFKVSGLDPSTVRRPPGTKDAKELGLPSGFEIDADWLSRAVTGCSMLDKAVYIRVDSAAVTVHAESDTDDGEFVAELDGEHIGNVEMTPDEPVESMFGSKYLTRLVGAMDEDRMVQVYAGDSRPMQVSQSFAGGDGHTRYLIAPRIQNQ